MVIHMFLRRATRRKTYATLGPDTALRVRHGHHRPGWSPPERTARRRSRTVSTIASAEACVAAVMVGNPGSLGERADGSERSFGAPRGPGQAHVPGAGVCARDATKGAAGGRHPKVPVGWSVWQGIGHQGAVPPLPHVRRPLPIAACGAGHRIPALWGRRPTLGALTVVMVRPLEHWFVHGGRAWP